MHCIWKTTFIINIFPRYKKCFEINLHLFSFSFITQNEKRTYLPPTWHEIKNVNILNPVATCLSTLLFILTGGIWGINSFSLNISS